MRALITTIDVQMLNSVVLIDRDQASQAAGLPRLSEPPITPGGRLNLAVKREMLSPDSDAGGDDDDHQEVAKRVKKERTGLGSASEPIIVSDVSFYPSISVSFGRS